MGMNKTLYNIIETHWKPFWFSLFFTLFFFIGNVFGQTSYYSQGNGFFNDKTLWSTISDGSGTHPQNNDFQNGNNTFIVQANDTMTVDARLSSINLMIYGYLIFNDDRVTIQSTIEIFNGATIDFNNFLINTDGTTILIEQGVELLNLVIDTNTGTVTSGFSTIQASNFLPVEMVDLTVTNVKMDIVRISWSTKTETQNYGFEIYRKVIGEESYKYVGFVRGFGYSTTTKDYDFLDNLWIGNYEVGYIIRQIDYDGKFAIYNTKIIEVDIRYDTRIRIAPNPSSNKVTVYYTNNDYIGMVRFLLYDISGRLIKNEDIYTSNFEFSNFTIDMSMYTSGYYIILLKFDGIFLKDSILLLK